MTANEMLNPSPTLQVQLVNAYLRERWGIAKEFSREEPLPLQCGWTFEEHTETRFQMVYWSGVRWLIRNRP